MKKIFFAILVCMSFSNSFAQSDKKLKKMTENNAEQIETLTSQRTNLKNELDSINDIIGQIKNRSFERETPEKELNRRLSCYKNVKELSEKFDLDLRKNKYKDLPLVGLYSEIVEMYRSISEDVGQYQKEKNDYYKSRIELLGRQINNLVPRHSEGFIRSFEKLAEQIEYYRYAMFELKRVIKLFDSMNQNSNDIARIKSTLKEDGETEIIDEIPFTKKLLNSYIDKPSLRDLIKSNPSFNTIK